MDKTILKARLYERELSGEGVHIYEAYFVFDKGAIQTKIEDSKAKPLRELRKIAKESVLNLITKDNKGFKETKNFNKLETTKALRRNQFLSVGTKILFRV